MKLGLWPCMSEKLATVIIPTYRDWQGLARSIDALSRQDFDNSNFEIIVCNNNDVENVPSDLNLPDNCRVIWEPKPGSYAARNAAIAVAKGDYLFFTDADCIATTGWISRGVQLFADRPELDRIAGKIAVLPSDGHWNGWCVCDSVFQLQQESYVRRGRGATANLVVRREVFDKVGPFSEDRFSGGDMEWNVRATQFGITIAYDAAMHVEHPARNTFTQNATKRRRLAGARFMAKADHPIRQRLPRLKYVLPSFRAAYQLWAKRADHSFRNLVAAMICHYILGWVYNAEIIRLGFFNGKASRV